MVVQPKLDYNGVTVVLSRGSRFDDRAKDIGELITGSAGEWFDYSFRPLTRLNCQLRTLDETAAFLPETRAVLLCGVETLKLLNAPAETRLSDVRGIPHDFPPVPGSFAIPTYHPQDAMDIKNYEDDYWKNKEYRGEDEPDEETTDSDEEAEGNSAKSTKNRGRTSRANFKFWMYQDCKKLGRLLTSGVTRNICHYEIYPAGNDVIDFLMSARDQHLYFDIETDPETFQLKCFSVGVSPKLVICVPVTLYNGSLAYSAEFMAKIFRALCHTFKYNIIVGHNIMFDLFVLMWKWRIPPPPWDQIKCTMTMHHRNYLGFEKSLAHCIALYTNQPCHKDEGNFFPRSLEQEKTLWQYNAKDVEVLPLIHADILIHGEKLGTLSAMDEGNQAIRWLMTMTYRGITVDLDNNHGLCAKIDKNESKQEFFINRVMPRLVGYPLNPRSADQVSNYLYTELHLKRDARVDRHTKTGTGKKSLYSLQIRYDIPAITLTLAMRRIATEQGKLKSVLWHKNKWTGAYNIAGPKSLRLSSNKLFGFYGTNMQNFKKPIKKLVIPDPGKELVQVDLAGVEAHIVAFLCKPGARYRELFIHGIKPHVYIGLILFFDHWCKVFDRDLSQYLHLPIAKLKLQKDWKEINTAIKESDNNPPSTRYYYFSKQTCHSSNYDITARTFCLNILEKSEGEVRLPLAEGIRFINTYHGTFPEIRQDFQTLIVGNLERDMTLTNLLGFKRRFYGFITHSMKKDAYSWIPQSTGSGCVAVIAGTQIQRKIEEGEIEPFFDILQDNHDSLLCQCEIGRGTEVARILRDHLNVELTSPYGEKFQLKSEAQVGMNWGGMQEIQL